MNWIGRTLAQIREEAALREALEHFLDERGPTPSTTSALEVRAVIQAHAGETPELKWALKPAPKPSLRWRIGEWLHIAGAGALIVVAAPVAIVAAPLAAVALRRRETTDPAPRLTPDDAHVQELGAVEDILAQNQFFAVGDLKPGRFRLAVARVVLWLVNLALRHYFNRGTLTGVKTIHAARWVFLDDYRRLMFASNYDGSLENYMDDFIDKVSWGLNAVFSNGVGYPRTNWLVFDGAEDEQAFKSYIRTRQKVSEVWYSAYGNLTTLNLENNAAIRAGLSGEMDEAQAQAWLRRL